MASLVFPFHDPQNVEFKFLKQIFPQLKETFNYAYVSITPQTVALNPEAFEFLQANDFFVVNQNAVHSSVGEHFFSGFKNATQKAPPTEILHLCSSDRLAFAITHYKQQFLHDLADCHAPTLFVRSSYAWNTHPKIYYAAESMVTEAGKILFGQNLDFAWCHLTLTSKQLDNILIHLTAANFVITAQVVFNLRKNILTQEVDWLGWEDPFIFGRDPDIMKAERESDSRELEKRMSYVKPQIEYLFEEYLKIHS